MQSLELTNFRKMIIECTEIPCEDSVDRAYVFSLMSAFAADCQSMGWKPMRRTAKMAVLRGEYSRGDMLTDFGIDY